MQSRISIIVPVYKVEKYIRKCIDSLLNQTYKNIEIIIVDDGSPDGCPFICDEYAHRFENIITYHKKNNGLSSARNYGVERANSDWIVFVDSDDYVESSYVEDLWKLKENFNADMSITRIVRENEDGSGRPAPLSNFEEYSVDNETALFEMYKGEKVGWSAYGKLIRKKSLLKYPFPDGYYEDCACLYRLIDDCKIVALGNYETNYHYVSRQGSILKNQLKEEHFHVFEICKQFENYIEENHPEMRILPIIVYRLAVTQMLNCQKMVWSQYKYIFKKYRRTFRKNVIAILKSKNIMVKSKYFFVLHCTFPILLWIQQKILKIFRS